MAARGKAVRSAVSSGHHAITKGMRKTRSIGQDIERWWKVNEVQIPGTKDALYRAFLDSLEIAYYSRISRTFLYQLLLAANLQLEVLFSDEKLLFQKDHQHFEHLLVLLRLEGNRSGSANLTLAI